jgi:hypothetical protein
MRGALPAQGLYVPPAESIKTVNVSTNNFDAEQGLAGGAAINVITKRGTKRSELRSNPAVTSKGLGKTPGRTYRSGRRFWNERRELGMKCPRRPTARLLFQNAVGLGINLLLIGST